MGCRESDIAKQLSNNNHTHTHTHIKEEEDFTGGTANKNLPAMQGADRFIPGLGSPTCHRTRPVHTTTESILSP